MDIFDTYRAFSLYSIGLGNINRQACVLSCVFQNGATTNDNDLSLNEAIDAAQNHPFWRLMSTFGAMHS